MAINFPTSLDTLTNPSSSDTLDSPSHSGQHSDINDAVEALETKVGVNNSAVNTTHDFKLSGISDGDYASSIAGTETLTNKTLTSPVINSPTGDVATITGTQTLTNKTLTLPVFTGGIIKFNAPEGFLLNGKIVPSVASNNLTVALKGLDGNDPSATNPIYIRIGDTVHSITGALSVTKNAGTNWFNAGSAELATKEIDYFVYLGYNATDGVVIGFSRIPYATQYNQFSATTTNEKYCAISTISNAAAGDVYTVVGRFAATLSAGAGYTWTVPTFTSINLIQRPIFKTRWLSFIPQCSGASPMTYTVSDSGVGVGTMYMINGDTCSFITFIQGATTGTASITIYTSLPFAAAYYTNTCASWIRNTAGNYYAGLSDLPESSSEPRRIAQRIYDFRVWIIGGAGNNSVWIRQNGSYPIA